MKIGKATQHRARMKKRNREGGERERRGNWIKVKIRLYPNPRLDVGEAVVTQFVSRSAGDTSSEEGSRFKRLRSPRIANLLLRRAVINRSITKCRRISA